MFAVLMGALWSCGEDEPSASPSGLPRILCTTGMLGDMVSGLTGGQADVTVLMGPGTDPHLYKASHGDLERLSSADVVVYNGLHLEGKMTEIFEQLGRSKKVLPVAETLPETELIMAQGAPDPHIWFDVALWARVGRNALDSLCKWYPERAVDYRKSGEAYLHELGELHSWVSSEMAEIPQENRVLVTAHDAFGYFGRAYGVRVKALQGISTQAEFGIRDVSELVNFIVGEKIPAIFVESSIAPRSMEAVRAGCRDRGFEVKLGGTLYSDALGAEGSPASTYAGMVRANAATIREALHP